ncbi:MAG: cation diffusion facilitator family transporter [Sulfolobaceae archaeon]
MRQVLICFWTVTVILFISFLFYNSITIFGEFIHSIIDAITVSFGYFAYRISKYSSHVYTYGLHRLEVFSAIVNSIAIIGAMLFITFDIIYKLIFPFNTTNGLFIALVSFVSLIIFLPVIKDKEVIIRGKSNINIRSIFIHTLSDIIQFIIGGIIGLLIVFLGLEYLDIIGGAIIAVISLYFVMPLLRESFLILMEGSPVELEKVETELSKVAKVHHIHVWSICSEIKVATLHVEASPEARLKDLEVVRAKIEDILREKFGINHTTIQFEVNSTDQATS